LHLVHRYQAFYARLIIAIKGAADAHIVRIAMHNTLWHVIV